MSLLNAAACIFQAFGPVAGICAESIYAAKMPDDDKVPCLVPCVFIAFLCLI